MAYDVNKLARLKDLKAAAAKTKADYEAKIKAITVPTYDLVKDETAGDFAAVYHLTKDGANIGVPINIPKDMVVQDGSVVENPDAQHQGTFIKLVLQNVKDPLYIDVGGLIEYVTSGSEKGDIVYVTVDPTSHKVTATITDGTITKAKLAQEVQDVLTSVANKVDKEDGKGLSTNDYTTAEKTKLTGISEGATKTAASDTNGNIKIDGVETKVYTEPADVVHGAIAEDAEVTEMLNEVFGTAE